MSLGAVAGAAPGRALAQDETYAGVTDALDAAELVPSAASALPPILPGQQPGARERGAAVAVPPPAEVAREWFGQSDWRTWSRATGDWGGTRTAAEDAGFDFNGSAITEWSRVFSGGTDNASAFRFLLDLNLTVDLEKLVDLKGGSVFADFQTADTGVGALVHGGFQPYSNIAIDGSITQLSQLWYEQWLFDDMLRIKLGKVDANTEFAYIPAAGGWWLVGDVPNFDGGTDDGTGGVYALAESRIWAPEGVDFENDDDTRGLWAFLQGGWSDSNAALAAQQYGGGLSLTGTFPGRDDDSTGIYGSYVVFGDDPASGLGDSEFSLELFYDIAITPYLHLKPDLQWFHDPSGDASTDDALVGTLRLTITF